MSFATLAAPAAPLHSETAHAEAAAHAGLVHAKPAEGTPRPATRPQFLQAPVDFSNLAVLQAGYPKSLVLSCFTTCFGEHFSLQSGAAIFYSSHRLVANL